MSPVPSARELAECIVACERCPRLVTHCREVARVKRRMYRDEEYWGRPVPSFGPLNARLLVVGLAPGAHGANRTGRVFTGDSSGDWLYRALHESGFANQPKSTARRDGLRLRDARVTSVVRCAPPQNKPTPEERRNCAAHFRDELEACRRVRVVLALGRIAFDGILRAWKEADVVLAEPLRFAHAAQGRTLGPRPIILLASYHPSRQNTQTGRLTREMFRLPFERARSLLKKD